MEPQLRGARSRGGLSGATRIDHIYLIQSGIARLLVLFPDRTCNDIEIDEYNRLTELQMEQIRDFIILHYKLTQRDDSPFWRQCASMEIPQTLTRKMELFRRRARPSPLNCVIGIGETDQGTEHLAEAVRPYLELASAYVSRDYGGWMEHLWIDLEMSPGRADSRSAWSFRFQHRVSLARSARQWGLPAPSGGDEPKNVGHFSVRPDYFKLAQILPDHVPAFLLRLVYDQSAVLEKKSRLLGGFDAKSFRRDLLEYLAGIDRAPR
jgi:hypothetical protein